MRNVVLAAIVVVIVIAAAYYMLMSVRLPSTSSSSSTYATTTVNATAMAIDAVNASLLTPVQAPYAVSYSKTFSTHAYYAPCNAIDVFVVYQNPPTFFAANYSLLNETVPFAVYDQVYVFNRTVYSTVMPGCPFINSTTSNDFISYASNYTEIPLSGIGTNALLQEFNNLTQYGLNNTDSLYIGPMPHLSAYVLTVAYKNYIIDLNTWGFYKHMNASMLVDYANYAISKLK